MIPSSMTPSPQALARWVRRGAVALASFAVQTAVESLEIGKRCLAWISHASGARTVAILGLAVVLSSGAAVVLAARARAATAAADRQSESNSDRIVATQEAARGSE
jgi:hypothetical protein